MATPFTTPVKPGPALSFQGGLPTPESSKKPSTHDLRYNPYSINSGERKLSPIVLDDESEDEVLPIIHFPRKSPKKDPNLHRAIQNILQSPPRRRVPSPPLFYHSDEDLPSPPDEPRHEAPSPTRNSANNPINLNEEQASDPPNDPNLDPGLMYTWSYDKKYATRWVLKYDPDQPRPEVALNPVFGTLPGLYIGKRWRTRMGAAWDGTHIAPVAGISGKVGSGAWSIALSGGYEDDFDEGYRFVYSGCGGRELLPAKRHKLNMAKQSKNQDWNIRNSALRENVQNEKPVRVIRGWKGDPVWSPDWGFMYCGLYEVVAAWVEAGKSGFDVIRFAFKRLPDQPPLVNGKGQVMPEPDYASEEWKGWEARLTDERADEILEIKKEETGSDVELRVPRRARTQKDRLYVKVEGSDDIYMAY